ncbi:MAG: DeoR family transcriptional regulator [Candidatus Cloacimonetes bacterium]|nr:DeoR family transcriptional regulator [Candidatus Cloacimonadota bacterium]
MIMPRLRIRVPVPFAFKEDGITREESSPALVAIREALVNSLCHRDYNNPKGNEIAIFKDRVEIYNPGKFPEGYTPDDFIKGKEKSILRNPLIANVLYLRKDIEKWGSGLKRIYDECVEKEIKVDFVTLKSGFSVIFYRHVGKGVGKNERQKIIVNKIKENQRFTIVSLSKELNVSEKTIERDLGELKKQNVIVFVGERKTGHWKIIDKNE